MPASNQSPKRKKEGPYGYLIIRLLLDGTPREVWKIAEELQLDDRTIHWVLHNLSNWQLITPAGVGERRPGSTVGQCPIRWKVKIPPKRDLP